MGDFMRSDYIDRVEVYCEIVSQTINESKEAIRHNEAEMDILTKATKNWKKFLALHEKEYLRAINELSELRKKAKKK